jgi:hypothetical protein
LCWLLDRGYAIVSSTELVGNRYNLTSRQRMAITRCACTAEAAQRRRDHQVEPAALRDQELWLDGFNVLLGLEVALAGGIVLHGRDGCCRDVAGIHARYARVMETIPALHLIAAVTSAWGVRQCRWYFDRPVSNSGRLRSLMLDMAAKNQWPWTVDLVFNPDKVLSETDQIIATSDSAVLDRCQRWINLAGLIISGRVPNAMVVNLCDPSWT